MSLLKWRRDLQREIQAGIDSSSGIPADEVFARLEDKQGTTLFIIGRRLAVSASSVVFTVPATRTCCFAEAARSSINSGDFSNTIALLLREEQPTTTDHASAVPGRCPIRMSRIRMLRNHGLNFLCSGRFGSANVSSEPASQILSVPSSPPETIRRPAGVSFPYTGLNGRNSALRRIREISPRSGAKNRQRAGKSRPIRYSEDFSAQGQHGISLSIGGPEPFLRKKDPKHESRCDDLTGLEEPR